MSVQVRLLDCVSLVEQSRLPVEMVPSILPSLELTSEDTLPVSPRSHLRLLSTRILLSSETSGLSVSPLVMPRSQTLPTQLQILKLLSTQTLTPSSKLVNSTRSSFGKLLLSPFSSRQCSGTNRFLSREYSALKITADPSLAASYESWVSYPITFQ